MENIKELVKNLNTKNNVDKLNDLIDSLYLIYFTYLPEAKFNNKDIKILNELARTISTLSYFKRN